MKISAKRVGALIVPAFMAVGAMVGFSAPANAVLFQGTTTGTFTSTGLPARVDATFTNGTFTGNDVGGFFSIGGTATNNLGTFNVGIAPLSFTDTFTLNVLFSSPPGTTPSPGVFTAAISAAILGLDNGFFLVDFDNSAHAFTAGGINFNLRVFDTSISPGHSAPLTGIIQVTQVPGPIAGSGVPALLAMVGGWVAWRRKRAATVAA